MECVTCIMKASNALKAQVEVARAKDETQRSKISAVEEEISRLKRSHEELLESHKALAKDCIHSRFEADRLAKKIMKQNMVEPP